MADDPDRSVLISPGPGDPDSAGVSVRTHRAPAAPASPCWASASAPVHGPGVRGQDRARPDASMHGKTSPIPHDGEGLLAGMPAGLPGRPLPLPVRRSRHAARGPLRDRHQPRRRRRHGPPPPHAAHRGRPVPPGVRAHAGRSRTCSPTSSGSRARAMGRAWTRSWGRSRPGAWRSGDGRRPTEPTLPTTRGDRRGRPMSDLVVRAAVAAIVEGPLALDGRGAPRDGRGDGRRRDAIPARGPAHGPADARRDGRRAGRLRGRDARAREQGRGARGHDRCRRHGRRRVEHLQHLNDRGARRRGDGASRSPSTATARSPPRRAPPT